MVKKALHFPPSFITTAIHLPFTLLISYSLRAPFKEKEGLLAPPLKQDKSSQSLRWIPPPPFALDQRVDPLPLSLDRRLDLPFRWTASWTLTPLLVARRLDPTPFFTAGWTLPFAGPQAGSPTPTPLLLGRQLDLPFTRPDWKYINNEKELFLYILFNKSLNHH